MQTSLIISPAHPAPVEARLTDPGEPGYPWSTGRDWYVAEQAWRWGEREEYVTHQSALTYSVVWACVAYISQTISSLGWHVFQRQEDGRTRLPIEDNIAWTLGMQASPEMTAFAWREVMLKDTLLWGNGYSEIERNNAGRVLWFWRLDPWRVNLDRTLSGKLFYDVVNDGGANTALAPSEVFHLKGMGSDGLVGYSVIEMARRTIELGMSEERFGQSFFRRGPMPGGVLEIPGNVKKEERDAMRESFQQTYGGSRNAGRVVVLTGGNKFTPLSLPNTDAQWLESQQFSIEQICRIFAVPQHKVNKLDRSTFCLPAGSLVSTEDGPRPIETIVPGEMLWSRGESGLVLAPVVHSVATGSDPILTITTTNRTLRCNARHPVLCRRKRPMPRSGAGGYQSVEWVTEYIRAGELLVGDTVVTLDRLPDAGSLEACPSRLPTIGFMEFCGLLLGDGNVLDGGSAYVTIARASRAAYMDYYREVIQNEFTAGGREWAAGEDHHEAKLTALQVEEIRALRSRIGSVSALARRFGVNVCTACRVARGGKYDADHPQAGIFGERLEEFRAALSARLTAKEIASRYGVTVTTVNNILSGRTWTGSTTTEAVRPVHLTEEARCTRFSSVSAVEELTGLGLSGTAKTKRVPGWAFRLPQSHRLALLRGFLDSDGSCDKKGRLSFSSCNRTLLAQIRELCMGCGVPVTNLYFRTGINRLPNGKRKKFAQYYFTCSDPGANRRIGSRDPRYVARLEAGQPFGRKERHYPRYGGEGFNEPGFSLARINRITVGPSEPVYDLEIAGTHSFIAEGVVVHNSNVEQMQIQAVQDCLLPWCCRLETEANVKLFGSVSMGRRYTKLNLETLLRGDSATQTENVVKQVNNGLRTVNEGRELLDLNPIDGGDTPLVQGAMIPLERALGTDAAGRAGAPTDQQAVAGGDVQATALNGAQITALLEIANGLADDQLPAEGTRALIEAAFPAMSRGLIDTIVKELDRFTPAPDPAAPPAPPQPAQDGQPADDGAMPADVRTTFLALLEDCYARLLRVEADKAKRADRQGGLLAWAETYYANGSVEHVAAALRPAVAGFLLATGRPVGRAGALASRLAQDHNERSLAVLRTYGVSAVENWNGGAEPRQQYQAVRHLDLLWEARS